MKTLADVEAYRKSGDAVAFARGWLKAQQAGDVTGDFHMNLVAWTSTQPFHALAVVLNLIDLAETNDAAAEVIALGPVQNLVKHSPVEFAAILRDAIRSHPGFAIFSKGARDDCDEPSRPPR